MAAAEPNWTLIVVLSLLAVGVLVFACVSAIYVYLGHQRDDPTPTAPSETPEYQTTADVPPPAVADKQVNQDN